MEGQSIPRIPLCHVCLSVLVLVYLILIGYQCAQAEFSLEQHSVGAAEWEAVGMCGYLEQF